MESENKSEKWYSNGKTSKDLELSRAEYGIIRNATYGLDKSIRLCLSFKIDTASSRSNWSLEDTYDIKRLYLGTDSVEIEDLEGKVVEVYSETGVSKCISNVAKRE